MLPWIRNEPNICLVWVKKWRQLLFNMRSLSWTAKILNFTSIPYEIFSALICTNFFTQMWEKRRGLLASTNPTAFTNFYAHFASKIWIFFKWITQVFILRSLILILPKFGIQNRYIPSKLISNHEINKSV